MAVQAGPLAERSGYVALACLGALLGGGLSNAADGPDPRPSTFVAQTHSGFSGRSVRVELKGGALFYQADAARAVRIVPTASQWRAFRRALDEAGVWSWRPDYHRNVSDAESWWLRIEYADRSLKSEGYAAGPEGRSFNLYLFAAQRLLGGRKLGARRVGELELFDVKELRLVATHPSRKTRDQWADIRTPSGKTHRVRIGSYVGLHFGIVKEVVAGAIVLMEVVSDSAGDWIQRETRMGTL
jgi:hypothetical protein